MNPFVLPAQQYKRNLNIVRAYVEQNALYLHKETGEPYDDCVQFVQSQIKSGGQFPIKDPQVLSLEQVSPGNRQQVERTFLGYVGDAMDKNWIISPSMVCYERPEVNKSTSAAFIEGGIKERKKAKKEQFEARNRGDEVLEYIKDCEQNAKKIGINSVSGMHGFSGNILYVKSGHSSLTSMCRTATGYGNANNEKFISGSRHYYHVDIVIANILNIIKHTDFDALDKVMHDYHIYYPTVEQTMECVTHSTSLYGMGQEDLAQIHSLVSKLTDLERSAFVYSGDLYHLAKYNDAMVRTFMDLIIDGQEGIVVEDAKATYDSLDDDTKSLVNYLNAPLFDTFLDDEGKTQTKTPKYFLQHEMWKYEQLAKTAANVKKVLVDYTPLIKVLWVPMHMPPSVANIKGIIRRTALASDTDSTIFTTQEWVKWYTGDYKRTRKGDGIWYTMTYLTTQCIIHVLAQFSANMGVAAEDIHRLSMKNEYAFPVFALTSRAKHYFAYMSAREGNVYPEYDSEIKGVALRSSIVPVHVIKRAKALMMEIMSTADKGEQLDLGYVYSVIWEFENDIIQSIAKGEARYLKTGQVKEKYKNMESSPYQHYLMWEEVFAPKYGSTPPPPYSVIKVPLEINNRTDMTNWLNAMDDQQLAERMKKWMEARGKTQVSTLLLPSMVLGRAGMPKEVMLAINTRKLTYEILESFYMLLETLGIFQIDSGMCRLVSDIYTPPDQKSIQEQVEELSHD